MKDCAIKNDGHLLPVLYCLKKFKQDGYDAKTKKVFTMRDHAIKYMVNYNLYNIV